MKKQILIMLMLSAFVSSCTKSTTKTEKIENPDGSVTTNSKTITESSISTIDTSGINRAKESVKTKVNKAGDKIDEAAHKTKESLNKVGRDIKKEAKEVGNDVKNAASKGAEKVEEGAKKLKEDLKK